MASAMKENATAWDAWGTEEPDEDDSAMPSEDEASQPLPYQSRLPEIDQMLNLQTRKYANKVRHGGQYRAILKATRSQIWDQEWLRKAEMDLWYMHSSDPFPGGLSLTMADTDGSIHLIQTEVSSSDSEGGGVNLDIDWNNGSSFCASPYVNVDDESSSDTSPSPDANVLRQFENIARREDTEGGAYTEDSTENDDAEDLFGVINSALATAVNHVQFENIKPKAITKPVQCNGMARSGTQRSGGLAHSPKMRRTSSTRYADMSSSSGRGVDVQKRMSPALSAALVTTPEPSMSGHAPSKKTRSRSHVFDPESYNRHSSGAGNNNGWVEFREPNPTPTPVSNGGWDNVDTVNLMRGTQEDAKAKTAAALSAWAAFPAQAAKEDKADALTYRHAVPSSTSRAAPVIKETFKKVVVSGDRFERKIVGETVEILE
ncbi:hypothetical protein IFR05_011048 [Cadophora sp. M221]|nr:hypothetical protein IFR05_011048 [Cadophora sp. M221]